MWTKICGIRDLATARAVAQLGPSAIGLNFYSKSVRSVDIETAAAIRLAIPVRVRAIGLFVNSPLQQVVEIVTGASLDQIQIHGDEPPEFLARLHELLPEKGLLRAWRVGGDGLRPWQQYFAECQRLSVPLVACLLDSQVAGSYGGTGSALDWAAIGQAYEEKSWPALVLAGGLNAGNVAQAIRESRCVGVDVASGVESSPGVKDLVLVKQFLTAAAVNDSAVLP